MSRILIITDQPLYATLGERLAGPSLAVDTIFAGDIAEGNFDALSKVRGSSYDSILHPATITDETEIGEKVFKFIYDLKADNDSCRVHLYANRY